LVFNEAALIHDKKSFTRETLTARFIEPGFNNLARILWEVVSPASIEEINDWLKGYFKRP
jgi:hypothetical protein